VSAERAVVTFVTVRLAADIAVDNWHCGCPTWTANNARDSCCAHDHLPCRGNQHRRRSPSRIRRAAAGDRDDSQSLPRRGISTGRSVRPLTARAKRACLTWVMPTTNSVRWLIARISKVEASCSSRRSLPQPDLLGLQEVALWPRTHATRPHRGRTDATEVDYDFLAILTAELAGRGVELSHSTVRNDVPWPAGWRLMLTLDGGSRCSLRRSTALRRFGLEGDSPAPRSRSTTLQ
jgi:hypothetical protein